MALEMRKYGSKKCGGKNQNCPEKPGHTTLGYITYSPESATPAQLTPPFPWHFPLHPLAFTLPVPCQGDEAFSLQWGGLTLPAVEMNAAAIHFLLGFHPRSVFNVSAAVTQGNLGWFLCLWGTIRSPWQVLFPCRSYSGPESEPAFLRIRAVEA